MTEPTTGAPGASVAPAVEPPAWTFAPFYLFFRPSAFFRDYVMRSVPALTGLGAWALGIASFLDQIERRLMGAEIGGREFPVPALVGHWGAYWALALAAGAASGALYYAIGGWWYRRRLLLCGAADADPRLARRVYCLASLVYALPFLTYTGWETLHYPSPLAAHQGDDPWALVVVGFLFWSVYASYRGVRTVFPVRAWPARWWFGILPAGAYAGALGAMVAGFLAMQLLVGAPPAVDDPEVISRDGFSLQHPRNWFVDASDDNYDPDHQFTIEPRIGDAVVKVIVYDRAVDPEAELDASLETLAKLMELGDATPFDRWGSYQGVGREIAARIDGRDYSLRLFCASLERRSVEVWELAAGGIRERMEPGFDLIRRSFVLRDPGKG
jgi:hypothetical protein